MKYLKTLLKFLLSTLISIIIFSFIITILYHFNIIKSNSYSILKMIIVLASLFINSFLLGKNSTKYGLIEGLKLGALFIIIMIITLLFTGNTFNIRLMIYSLIILLTTSTGSVIGINKKDIDKD